MNNYVIIFEDPRGRDVGEHSGEFKNAKLALDWAWGKVDDDSIRPAYISDDDGEMIWDVYNNPEEEGLENL